MFVSLVKVDISVETARRRIISLLKCACVCLRDTWSRLYCEEALVLDLAMRDLVSHESAQLISPGRTISLPQERTCLTERGVEIPASPRAREAASE